MSMKRPHDEGFTLVEVLLVMVILGILVAIALLTYFSATARARTITCEHNQRLFNEAVYVHEAEKGFAPAVMDDLEDYVTDYDAAIQCPEGDGTLLQYDAATKKVTCANH
jgi:prepilin-type N-terminal cleavage/methylation domain-containing protein